LVEHSHEQQVSNNAAKPSIDFPSQIVSAIPAESLPPRKKIVKGLSRLSGHPPVGHRHRQKRPNSNPFSFMIS
jgi:hypothetical protein